MIASGDIAVVMPTVERSDGVSYLRHTIERLLQSGVDGSARLKLLTISRDRDRIPHLNVISCLLAGYRSSAPWVLFLEDDIDVCGDFLDSVGRWLDDHGYKNNATLVFSFGCTKPETSILYRDGIYSLDYPAKDFFGTQAFAIRHKDIPSLVDHLSISTRDSGTYDLMIGDWGRFLRGPECKFLASSPSFVQHIGESSSIRPGTVAHKFESWPGREWSYGGSTEGPRGRENVIQCDTMMS